MSADPTAPPAPPDQREPTDAELRRKVAEIEGWRFHPWKEGTTTSGVKVVRVTSPRPGYDGDYLCREGWMNDAGVPHYESDLNAAEAAVRRWCDRQGWIGALKWIGASVSCQLYSLDQENIESLVPASHPHAAARALCLALVKADEAVSQRKSPDSR